MESYYHPNKGLVEVGDLVRDHYGVIEVTNIEATTNNSSCICKGKIITRNHIDSFKDVLERAIHSKHITIISPKSKSKMRWEKK